MRLISVDAYCAYEYEGMTSNAMVPYIGCAAALERLAEWKCREIAKSQ